MFDCGAYNREVWVMKRVTVVILGCLGSAMAGCDGGTTGGDDGAETAERNCAVPSFELEDLPLRIAEVPAELQFVLDNRELFEGDAHPLEEVTPGTIVDDPAEGLSGCWGRVATEEVDDSPIGEDGGEGGLVDVLVAEVLRFDLDTGMVQQQKLIGVEQPLMMYGDLPAVVVFDIDLLSLSDDQIELEFADGDGGVINDDGTLGADLLVLLQVSFSLGARITQLLTLNGDALATWTATADSEPQDAINQRSWFRFDCITDDIQKLPVENLDEILPTDLCDQDISDVLEDLSEDIFDLFMESSP